MVAMLVMRGPVERNGLRLISLSFVRVYVWVCGRRGVWVLWWEELVTTAGWKTEASHQQVQGKYWFDCELRWKQLEIWTRRSRWEASLCHWRARREGSLSVHQNLHVVVLFILSEELLTILEVIFFFEVLRPAAFRMKQECLEKAVESNFK